MPSTPPRDVRATPLARHRVQFDQGRPPRSKGQRYPADPPTVEEIIAVMHAAEDDHDAVRLSPGLEVLT